MENEQTEQVEARRIPVPGVSRETAALVERLKTGTHGDLITDVELSKLIGKDTRPNHKGYSNLMSAIGRCLREYRILWQRVRQENCIECVNDIGKVEVVKSKRQQIHRKARKSMRVSASVDLDGLDDAAKRLLLTETAITGTIALATKESTAKKLQARSFDTALSLPKLLEMFPK